MGDNGEFVSALTEFPRDSPEEEERSSFGFSGLSKIFSFYKSTSSPDTEVTVSTENAAATNAEEALDRVSELQTNQSEDGRSLPNVLKRIRNLIVKDGPSNKKATNIKQYWMPDSSSNECYDCGEKFTTLRRRHHCRVCGQIFCSRCCNQKIPGKIMGRQGDLRVCTYCCKVVLSYLQSADITADLSADLKALQEDLQIKLGRAYEQQQPNVIKPVDRDETVVKRKASVGYQEERFVLGQAPSCPVLSDEERCQALQNSSSLRSLFVEMLHPITGAAKQLYQDIPECVFGNIIVEWLIANSKAATRVQALAMGQMLLEAGYLEPMTEQIFTDGGWYRLASHLVSTQEGSWSQIDSESDRMSEGDDECGIPKSGSTYLLDMNVGDKVVHVARPSPPKSGDAPPPRRKKVSVAQETNPDDSAFLDPPPQSETNDVTLKSWHRAGKSVRPLLGEADAYKRITSAFEVYEAGLLNQLLVAEGLSTTWSEIILNFSRSIVDLVQLDYRLNDEMDIRQYVQVKKLPGGSRDGIRLIRGVVCTKNIAHRGMRSRIDKPRILLLSSAIVYQRVEGRMLSLEPVMMQEHEYLKHIVARIVFLKPDVVLVHKNVSRLAQDYLLDNGITLVLNVKTRTLQRLSRLTGADIISSVDAQVAPPTLGTAKSFYLNTYKLSDGTSKTLMFFEGTLVPDVCCTVLLSGGTPSELVKLKKILSFMVLTEYNWRLEKSFLMDELARPPSPPPDIFQDSPIDSPTLPYKTHGSLFGRMVNKISTQPSSTPVLPIKDDAEVSFDDSCVLEDLPNEETADPVNSPPLANDSSDSLQPEMTDPLQTSWVCPPDNVKLSVSELPRGNKFRSALDDTILSISPFLKLNVPYLESDTGRNCRLRSYFPDALFHSKQFSKQEKEVKNVEKEVESTANHNLLPKHEFLTMKMVDDPSNSSIQFLLALYRANGGRIPFGTKGEARKQKQKVEPQKLRDVLDPFEHQKFSVLFCSYSAHSENAPAFCVDPWVVTMVSYGPNDIPLGHFLEKYCFLSAENCPSRTCHVPMQKHSRRFVHDAGALCLTINSLPKNLAPNEIWMWNWCIICKVASPMVPITADTWRLSFAKYLELRFLGDSYIRRGTDTCKHGLHHEHYQYFAKDNVVASFKFVPIRNRWEISLPPRLISIMPVDSKHSAAVDELRQLVIKGHDTFSFILEYIVGLEVSEEERVSLITQQQKDQSAFKTKVEDIQFRLTSPTLESKKFEPDDGIETREAALWRIDDSLNGLKRSVCEAVVSWNGRLVDYKRKDDKGKRHSDGNVKLQESTPVSEDGKTKEDEESSSTFETEDEQVWEKGGESLDSEDNQSVASHQDENKPEESQRRATIGSNDKMDESTIDSKADKKTVKNILTQILASNKELTPIQCPWSPQEHYLLPPGLHINIVVNESEPSSIISYALASNDYQRYLEEKRNSLSVPSNDTSSSPSPVRKKTLSSSSSGEKEHPADPITSTSHCEVIFNDATANFSCRVYHAEDFSNLRSLVFPAGEEVYLRSLSRCVQWAARGGKSGSNFCKTKDDRFVIKEMRKLELNLFLELASQYLAYVTKCHNNNQPTLLGKIVGVYTVSCRNSAGSQYKSNLLVMENLFYRRAVTHKYDLKGSVRNRLVNPVECRDSDIVYMDANLLKMTCDSPLYILPHSQAVLMRAIESDTEFLAAQDVMDYSLLVGLEETSSELVIGIIDYIRTFTWDKRLENMVKTSVAMGNPVKQPTIIQPKDYRNRFIAAMKRYFLPVPDRWYEFGLSSSP